MESTGYHGSDIEPNLPTRAAAQKERRNKWKEEKSIFCFFVQGFHTDTKSLDQLHPLNEISPALLETLEQISDTDVVVAVIISISAFVHIVPYFKCSF